MMDVQVLDFEEAVSLVLQHAAAVIDPIAIPTEQMSLLASAGRVLAEAVTADRDQPPFDRATRDGYAIRAADLVPGRLLPVAGQVRAGEAWQGPPLVEGEAIEIMTGAPIPEGADSVVMVEHVEPILQGIRPLPERTLRAGDNVVPRGSEAQAGETILPVGTTITAAEIALAAACGHAELAVFRRPRVAIIATGDELVELDQAPKPQQIRNSNSYALAALVAACGGEPVRLPVAADQHTAVRNAISAGRDADLLLLSGGVSMGQYDLVEEVLQGMGAEFFFTGVRMQPGKPVVFGRLPATQQSPAQYFFGLPGNPISTQVTFHVFAATMIRALAGAGAHPPQWVQATLAEDVPGKPGLTRLLPARLLGTRSGAVEVRLVGWQGSGDQTANARANCYCLLAADREAFKAGEVVRILLR